MVTGTASHSAPPAIPVLGHLIAYRRDQLGFLARTVREHGDVVPLRFGPFRMTLLGHPEHVERVLVAGASQVEKSPVLKRARQVLGDGLLTSEGEHHRRMRRLLQPAFSRRAVASAVPTMTAAIDAGLDAWQPGEPVDAHATFVRTTVTVAGRSLLGTDLDDADIDEVERGMAEILSAYSLALLPFGHRLERMPVPQMRRLRRGRARLERLIARTREAGDGVPALLRDAGADDASIRDELVTLLLAGHETTANALAFACVLLAADPGIQERLAGEATAVCGDRTPEAADVERLPFARAVLAEALRLYPPSYAIGRTLLGPMAFDGHPVAASDAVILSQWVVHRDPRWWPDPERFDPGRWLEPDTGRPRRAYFPFGAGIRQCIGEHFAWTEGTLALSALARRWRLQPAPGKELRLAALITLRPAGGAWIVPHPRTST